MLQVIIQEGPQHLVLLVLPDIHVHQLFKLYVQLIDINNYLLKQVVRIVLKDINVSQQGL